MDELPNGPLTATGPGAQEAGDVPEPDTNTTLIIGQENCNRCNNDKKCTLHEL